MLPTEKTSSTNIWLNKNNKKPRIENYSPRLESFGWINQHLYILSDDEIKEGDWMYNTHHNIISKGPGGGNHYDKKIVATTDKSLNECNVCGMSNGDHKMSCKTTSIITKLPQLPESFIQAFIKAYNEGYPITEVAVEYTDPVYGNDCNSQLGVIL